MFYEIDSNGIMLRALPGYFKGFKEDLADADVSILSDMQRDYISIPDERILEVSEEEHGLMQYKAQASAVVSQRSYSERSAILDDQSISNIAIGATSGYPAYLTSANVAAIIEQFKAIAKQAKAGIQSATTKAEIDTILNNLVFPTAEQILSQINGGS